MIISVRYVLNISQISAQMSSRWYFDNLTQVKNFLKHFNSISNLTIKLSKVENIWNMETGAVSTTTTPVEQSW